MRLPCFLTMAVISAMALAALGNAAPTEHQEPPLRKYFHEDPYDSHLDDRFAPHFLPTNQERENLIRILVQTYLSTMRDLGIQTWLMHGTLLAWWWGQKIMPWDFDADVQVNEADIYFLAAYHNMTVYYYKYGDMEQGRYFQLEVNPYFRHRGQDDRLNAIDARWIDMASGLFIDITAARYDLDHEEGEGVLYDKSGHEYRDSYIFPLRDTMFEGVPAKIPFRYKDMLRSEYGKGAMTNREYNGHTFDTHAMRWVPDKEREVS